MRKIILVAAAVFAVAVPTANAYDRKPINFYGMHYDGWAFSISQGEGSVRYRYSNINWIQCRGVIMIGPDEEYSSFMKGNTRYWDKLFCVGFVPGRVAPFSMVVDAKGPTSWIVYSLRGASIADLG